MAQNTITPGQQYDNVVCCAVDDFNGSFPHYSSPGKEYQVPNAPKIYLYKLPERFRNCSEVDTYEAFSNYGAETYIPTALKESPYVTSNPEEADFFWVTAYLYCISGTFAVRCVRIRL